MALISPTQGKHLTDWVIENNCLQGKYHNEEVTTEPIVSCQRYADMRIVTTQGGATYFIYNDRK